MIKYVVPAVVVALALGASVAAQAQTMAPQPLVPPAPNMSTNANAAIVGQPQPGPDDYYNQDFGHQGSGAPMVPNPYAQPGPAVSPRTVWIPGAYNWDPNSQKYVWTEGQYVEAPRENTQWMPGHWTQTPTAWIWVDGRWN